MDDILFWLYLTNTLTLIVHEIDSAYWKEWGLFHLPGGEVGFLLLHFPLLFPVLFGLVLVDHGAIVRNDRAAGLDYHFGGCNDCDYELDKKTSLIGFLCTGLRAFVDG